MSGNCYKSQCAIADRMVYALVGPPRHENHIDLAFDALQAGRKSGIENVDKRPYDALMLIVGQRFALDNDSRGAA